jgi:hypothetical protein
MVVVLDLQQHTGLEGPVSAATDAIARVDPTMGGNIHTSPSLSGMLGALTGRTHRKGSHRSPAGNH